MPLHVATNPSGQRNVNIDGKTYEVQTNRFGDDIVVIDGKQCKLSDPIFQNTAHLDYLAKQLEKAKEKASMWSKIFDLNLEGVRQNRRDRMAFVQEHGNDMKSMNDEQQAEYKNLLAQKCDYTSGKNRALAEQLSYTNTVISLAGAKQNALLSQSIFMS